MIQITNLILIFANVGTFTMVVINYGFDLNFIGIISACMHTRASSKFHEVSKQIWRMILFFGTIYVDVSCLMLVRQYRSQPNLASNLQTEDKHIMNEPPMRSTILNIGLILLELSVVPYVFQHGEAVDGLWVAIHVTLVFLILKSPLITFWTFKVNAANSAVDQNEKRERLRNLELEEAKKKRALRKFNQLADKAGM